MPITNPAFSPRRHYPFYYVIPLSPLPTNATTTTINQASTSVFVHLFIRIIFSLFVSLLTNLVHQCAIQSAAASQSRSLVSKP
jgi:hypothetical protein